MTTHISGTRSSSTTSSSSGAMTRCAAMNMTSVEQGRSALGAADVLALAAAPTFVIMALLTGVLGGAGSDAICSATHASTLGGMIPMYLLMSAFHSAPWLRLIPRRRSRGA